jgi:hypothetical protein
MGMQIKVDPRLSQSASLLNFDNQDVKQSQDHAIAGRLIKCLVNEQASHTR